jgi:transcriptional regulator with XRE-family HTH domain
VDTVKEIRRRKGWSQKDLAEESGVGQDTISGIESGRHEPRPSTLRKLADALDVEVADFFREPAVPLADAPKAGPPSAKDLALDAARRQVTADRQTHARLRSSEGQVELSTVGFQNEAFRALLEYPHGDVAEALNDVSKRLAEVEQDYARLEEENATLRDRLQAREQAHS